MSTAALEKRIAVLEAEFTKFRAQLDKERAANAPDWRRIVGTFENDPAFEEAMRLGRQWRESQRPSPRRRSRRKVSR